ncbi:hypothetical protein NQ317_009198 [Molorchus minor]|uniref:Uncharacterized protein n=1 Tax=Molorchus minor TaxID=1323400 RepID=A0ABQ9JCW0_9CUCU|nr:hypothetical protein NQ317_009198 [Molorchus minor]
MADVTQTPIPQEVVNNDLMIAKLVAIGKWRQEPFDILAAVLWRWCFTIYDVHSSTTRSTAKLRILGEARSPPQFGFPPSELVFCLGFFFVYLIEEVVHLLLDRKMHDEPLHRSLSVRRCSSNKDLSIPRVTLAKFDDGNISYISTSNKELLNSQTTINVEKHGHSHHEMDESLKNSFGGFLAVLALSFHAVFEGLAVGLESSVQKCGICSQLSPPIS